MIHLQVYEATPYLLSESSTLLGRFKSVFLSKPKKIGKYKAWKRKCYVIVDERTQKIYKYAYFFSGTADDVALKLLEEYRTIAAYEKGLAKDFVSKITECVYNDE